MPRSSTAGPRVKEPSDATKKAIHSAATDLKKKLNNFSKSLKGARLAARGEEEKKLLDLRIRVADNLADQIETICIHPPFGLGFLQNPCVRRHR